MNIEKMKEVIQLLNELREKEGVFGFNFHGGQFHVSSEKLINEPDLQFESRGSDDYPYEVFVERDGFRIFALLRKENLKDFPQFKEQAKAELLKQLQYLEEDVDLSGMEEGEEHAS